MRSIIVLLLVFLVSNLSIGQHEQYKFERFIKDSDTLLYRVLLPENFDTSKTYPMLLFLHGAGERGSDNEKQLTHGSALFIDADVRKKFPAVVIFPQCPTDSYWAQVKVDRNQKPVALDFQLQEGPTKPLSLVIGLMDEFVNKPFIDTSKVYLGGLSMGAMGTFELLHRRPETFAASFAICGAGDPDSVSSYADKVPIWIFHGAKDDVVNPIHSLEMASAILKYGGTPKLTIYDRANHNSWDQAFSESELLSWLFNHQKQ